MSSILKDLGIDRLSLDRRLDLMHEIWDSISTEDGRNLLTKSRKEELERHRLRTSLLQTTWSPGNKSRQKPKSGLNNELADRFSPPGSLRI